MTDLRLASYRIISTPEERATFRQAMESSGYYAFYAFVEDFRGILKAYADEDLKGIDELLFQTRIDFSNPGRFSPSWDKLWDEFEHLYHAKNDVLRAIPHAERDGEWQVLLDNPYLPQQVVCYPNLAFSEAAYMYAYFQKDLKPNEILRLQKVTRLLTTSGNKEVSILPEY